MGRAFEYRRAAKEKRWDKMSKVFPKLASAITLAAKEGGKDPELNSRLRTAIANAKAQNMPKDNITAAIKRADKSDEVFTEITYEGKMAPGVLLYIECMTNNTTRTIANIKSYFNKTKGLAQIVPQGSLGFMFDRRCIFCFSLGEGSLEELELELIDAGLLELERLEEVEDLGSDAVGKEVYVAYGEYKDFHNLQLELERRGCTIYKARLVYTALDLVDIDEAAYAEVEKLTDRLEDDDDVYEVYTNIGEVR